MKIKNRNKLTDKLKQNFMPIIFFSIICIATLINEKICCKATSILNKNVDINLFSPKIVNDECYFSNFNIQTKNNQTELVDKLEYIKGVVAGEIDVDSDIEALKAQAVAAFTYAVFHKKLNKEPFPITTLFQVYSNKTERENKFKDKFNEKEEKLNSLVKSVENEVITYNNKIINSVYFASSPGQTASSSTIWNNPLKYLISVSSPETIITKDVQISLDDLKKLINNLQNKNDNTKIDVEENLNNSNKIEISKKDSANFVIEMKIFGKTVSGNKIRQLLNLPSTNFEVITDSTNCVFKCKGHGHCVGMSQRGAIEMAKKGKNYKEILKHYYPGVNIQKINEIIN